MTGQWRKLHPRSAGEEVSPFGQGDLYVRKNGHISEIFELKTSTDRYSLYTAVGQLITYSIEEEGSVLKTLVVPEHGTWDGDFELVIKKLNIGVLRYRLQHGRAKTKVEILHPGEKYGSQ